MTAFFCEPMFYVYILQSESTGRFYIGHTNNLDRQLAEHNDPASKDSLTTKRFTKTRGRVMLFTICPANSASKIRFLLDI
jgi:predicted GIY-YIG superfamily endonuclease